MDEAINLIDQRWAEIETNSGLLKSDTANRLGRARSKVIVHFERADNGLVALDDDPQIDEGKLTWREPITFMNSVREFTYDVFLLMTSNSWSDGRLKTDFCNTICHKQTNYLSEFRGEQF